MCAAAATNIGAFRREPGDWTCLQCNEVNFKSRSACRRCSTARHQVTQTNNTANNPNPQPAVRQGDWTCRFCNINNFASRNACYKCNRQKPELVGSNIPSRPSDWTCNHCNNINFAARIACHKCARPKSTPMEVNPPPPPPPPPPGPPSQIQTKPGDWKCSSCPETNFGSRIVCRSCGANRPSSETNNIGECVICMDKPIDSVITTCGHSAVCLQCGNSITQCPICRNPFNQQQIIKFYNVH